LLGAVRILVSAGRLRRAAIETVAVCLGGDSQEHCERLVEFSGEMFASMNRRLSGAELS
jgi:hypothetical protein